MQDDTDGAAKCKVSNVKLSQRKTSALLPPPHSAGSAHIPLPGGTNVPSLGDNSASHKSEQKSFGRGGERFSPYNVSAATSSSHHHHHHHHHHQQQQQQQLQTGQYPQINNAQTSSQQNYHHQAPPPQPQRPEAYKPLDKMKIITDRKLGASTVTSDPKPLRFIDKLAKPSSDTVSNADTAKNTTFDRLSKSCDKVIAHQDDLVKTHHGSEKHQSFTSVRSTTNHPASSESKPAQQPPQHRHLNKETFRTSLPVGKSSDKTYERVMKPVQTVETCRKAPGVSSEPISGTPSIGSKQFERVKQDAKTFDRLTKPSETTLLISTNILSTDETKDISLKSEKGWF